MVVPFHPSTTDVWPTALPTFGLCNFSHSGGCVVVCHHGFSFLFPDDNDVVSSQCLLVVFIWLSSFMKGLPKFFVHFKFFKILFMIS